MGCSSSLLTVPLGDVPSPSASGKSKRTFSSSNASLDCLEAMGSPLSGSVLRRYGHPSSFRLDGFDIGLRVRVKGLYHSTFVGCSRRTYDRVTIKEYHLQHYPTTAKEPTNTNKNNRAYERDAIILNEILVLARLNHECVPKLSEIFLTDSAFFLVTPYVDPFRLSNFIDSANKTCALHYADVRRIFKFVCSAVAHCHEHGVIVRDLSPQNVMVKKSGLDIRTGGSLKIEVLLVDFSLSVQEEKDVAVPPLSDHPHFEWNLVPFTAPEALLGEHCGKAMDCWALGALLYLLLSGHQAFHHEDDSILVQYIQRAKFDFKPEVFDSIDDSAKDLIKALLLSAPDERLTFHQILKHRWLVDQ